MNKYITEEQFINEGFSASNDKEAKIRFLTIKSWKKGFGGKLYRLVEVSE